MHIHQNLNLMEYNLRNPDSFQNEVRMNLYIHYKHKSNLFLQVGENKLNPYEIHKQKHFQEIEI